MWVSFATLDSWNTNMFSNEMPSVYADIEVCIRVPKSGFTAPLYSQQFCPPTLQCYTEVQRILLRGIGCSVKEKGGI